MDTYVCSICHNEYEYEWTEEEAINELNNSFPGFKTEDCCLVCDNCFNKMFH